MRAILLCLCLSLLANAPARAEESGAREAAASVSPARMAEARALYGDGTRAYDAQRYLDALRLFEQAYERAPLPGFLFNIGQCHRQLNDPAQARAHFESYLAAAPDAPNRREVERLIEEAEVSMELATQTPAEASTTSAAVDSPDQSGALLLAGVGVGGAVGAVVAIVLGVLVVVAIASAPSLGRIDLREAPG